MIVGFIGYTMVYSVLHGTWAFWEQWIPQKAPAA